MLESREITQVVRAVLDGYTLDPLGVHGLTHWARVLDNGRRIAEATGADTKVVDLFALLHDSRRVTDGHDPGHGARGGLLARQLYESAFELTDRQLEQLVEACDGHTDRRTHADATIASCWDADRLDLGRVGMAPHPRGLAILFDRVDEKVSHKLVQWADGRAVFAVTPGWFAEILDECLDGERDRD